MEKRNNKFDLEIIERTTVQLSTNSIIWLDEHGNIKHANNAACNMLMYNYQELTSMNVFDISPNFRSNKFTDEYTRKLKKQGKHHFETLAMTQCGKKIPIEVIIFSMKYEEMDIFCSIFFDISERKKIMTDLINSEERIRAILNNNFQLTGLLDIDGRLLMINQTALDFISVTEDKVIGKYFWQCPWFQHSKDLQDEVKKYFKNAARGNFVRAEWETFDKSGKKYIFDNSLKPVKDANGDIRFVIPEARDITEIKKTEKELKIAYKELEKVKDRLQDENFYLKEELQVKRRNSNLIGESAAFKKVLFQIDQVASTNATVLILGETGTGKELVAQRIHDLSFRRDRPLITLNCAAIPSSLIESELFGHEKGAFTGAHTLKIGRFELADKGTIFLDEIGELPIDLQAKLLRVLQENEFERIGGGKTLKVDIRIIAATNRDLEAMIAKKQFRQDLYYRLNVFPVNLPPLRERKSDIPLLSDYLIKHISQRIGKKFDHISKKTMEKLKIYHWPGNIRELANVLERSAVLSQEDILKVGDWFRVEKNGFIEDGKLLTLNQLQRKHIIQILLKTRGRVRGYNGAAQILGIKPTTLESRMAKLKINKSEILDNRHEADLKTLRQPLRIKDSDKY